MDTVGLFRIPGTATSVAKLKQEFNQGIVHSRERERERVLFTIDRSVDLTLHRLYR
jgi:hypothetical protein